MAPNSPSRRGLTPARSARRRVGPGPYSLHKILRRSSRRPDSWGASVATLRPRVGLAAAFPAPAGATGCREATCAPALAHGSEWPQSCPRARRTGDSTRCNRSVRRFPGPGCMPHAPEYRPSSPRGHPSLLRCESSWSRESSRESHCRSATSLHRRHHG